MAKKKYPRCPICKNKFDHRGTRAIYCPDCVEQGRKLDMRRYQLRKIKMLNQKLRTGCFFEQGTCSDNLCLMRVDKKTFYERWSQTQARDLLREEFNYLLEHPEIVVCLCQRHKTMAYFYFEENPTLTWDHFILYVIDKENEKIS